MRRLTHAAITVCLCVGGAWAGPAGPGAAAALPDLTAGQGRALVALARRAMRRYLAERVAADAVPVGPELAALHGQAHAAAVMLRREGEVVALEIAEGASLCRNVIAAALRAMRSGKLPDRVDRKVLDSLTVEVEVLSASRPVGRAELARAVVPGLTGLAYCRGASTARVLPSAAYVLGLDAEQLRRAAMAGFRLTSENASLPARLEVFTTHRYVGLADGPVVGLFRGKDLSRRAKVSPESLSGAAAVVAAFLVRHQDKDGRYTAAGQPADLADHLYATYAMARLAGRRPEGRFADSATKAAGLAYRFLRRAGGRAVVAGKRGQVDLAATALLALVLGQAAGDDETRRLRGELRASLAGELAGTGATTAASRPATASKGVYLGILALAAAGDERVASLRAGARRLRPADAAAALWACRAGVLASLPLASPAGAAGGPAIAQRGKGALPDEVGGFAPATGGPPQTVLTGLAAVCLAGRRRRPDAADRQLLAARRFCYAMLYQPAEAYFASDPARWVGGARAAPPWSAVTVAACAAALEAFLTRPTRNAYTPIGSLLLDKAGQSRYTLARRCK